MAKQTIIVDFDGTISTYSSGWQGADVILDKPVEGVREAIIKLREVYKVVVYSTRCHYPGGAEAIQKWLDQWKIPVDQVVSEKVPSVLQVDDRAFRFEGDWDAVLEFASNKKSLAPWYKKTSS